MLQCECIMCCPCVQLRQQADLHVHCLAHPGSGQVSSVLPSCPLLFSCPFPLALSPPPFPSKVTSSPLGVWTPSSPPPPPPQYQALSPPYERPLLPDECYVSNAFFGATANIDLSNILINLRLSLLGTLAFSPVFLFHASHPGCFAFHYF